MTCTTRPLTDRTWLRPSSRREGSRFDASWSATAGLLSHELALPAARNAVIEVDVGPEAIRLDGELRASARAASPAVIVSFDTRKRGPLMYRCDRYGATTSGEQYRGWSAIGSEPFAPHKATMSEDEAWARLADLLGVPVANARVDAARTLRRAARVAHPDTGGNTDLWASYEAAAAVVCS